MHKLSYDALSVPDNVSQGRPQVLIHGARKSLLERSTHSLEMRYKRGLSDFPNWAHSVAFGFQREYKRKERSASHFVQKPPLSILGPPGITGEGGTPLHGVLWSFTWFFIETPDHLPQEEQFSKELRMHEEDVVSRVIAMMTDIPLERPKCP